MIKSDFKLEQELLSYGYDAIIGIDEAGRGPLAGPVVACAVVLKCHPREDGDPVSRLTDSTLDSRVGGNDKDKNNVWDLVRDSKTLSEKQREKAFDFVTQNFHVGVGICDHRTIDRINILEATFLAMKKAIAELNLKLKTNNEKQQLKTILLVDGNKQIPNFSLEQKAVVNGDRIVKSISAASIIAKVTRDRMMMEAHAQYPEYGFDRHKGYGTKFHMDALQKCGPCPIHRQTFAPVTNLAKSGE